MSAEPYTVPENMLPFDLEIALAHPERVRTRDGREVVWLTAIPPHINKKTKRTYPVTAYVADYGPVGTSTPDTYGYWSVNTTYVGYYYEPNHDGSHTASPFDLFLSPE